MLRSGIVVWRMVGGSGGTTAHATDSGNGASPQLSFNVPANGGAVEIGYIISDAAVTATGLTLDHQSSIEIATQRIAGASDNFSSAQTPLSAGLVGNIDQDEWAVAGASFG